MEYETSLALLLIGEWRSDGYKHDNGVGSGIYSLKLGLNISLQLRDYCSVFQAKVEVEVEIYRAAQYNFVNGAPFIPVSVFSVSRAAIRSL